jgi:tetratricopeptide (TPR) repeat protein
MGRCNRAFPHLPYFEALAHMSESSADWRAISAGLVTLRLVDAWVSEGTHVVAAHARGLRAVRELIAAIEVGNSARALLTSVVDSMVAAPTVRVSIVAPRLMAYARGLQFDGHWALAADVYRTVIAHSQLVEDADVVVAANMQLGACLRVLADWSEAAIAYTTAGQIAALTGDVMNVLRARLAEANLAMDRGNLPRAEAILDETIRSAAEAGQARIRAMALQDRGVLAQHRGDLELAVCLGYEAVNSFHDQVARDRAMVDLAAAFQRMGLRSAARDANLILAATAQEQYTRWVATINLMEIASLDGSEPVFEQYRRELAGANLPAVLAAYYHYYVGQGFRLFDRFEAAKASLERAIEIAARHQLNEVLIKAEQSLQEIRDGGVIFIASAPQPSPAVAEVADAVRELRALAGMAD